MTKNINLPYIKGTTERIAKILRKENIKVSFSPPNSLRTMLDHAKDSINPSLHRGVYSIPCTCGKQYIGETGRSFQIRLKEHIADIKHNRVKKSALAEHYHHTGHHLCIEDTKFIAKIDHYEKRKIWEALEIELQKNNLNRDDGMQISEAWKPVLNKIKS